MIVATCGSCRFSAAALGADRKVDFSKRICKFMPPVPLVTPGPQGVAINFFWPILDVTQSCGQHQARGAEQPLPGEAPLVAEAQKAD